MRNDDYDQWLTAVVWLTGVATYVSAQVSLFLPVWRAQILEIAAVNVVTCILLNWHRLHRRKP